MKVAILLSLAAGAAAHGQMNYPPTRINHTLYGHDCKDDGIGGCLWFNQGCMPGCGECKMDCGLGQTSFDLLCCAEAYGYALRPTLDKEMWSYPTPGLGMNPWRSAGHSPVNDPCGIAGGNARLGNPGNGGYAPPTHAQGYRGSDLPMREDVPPTVWKSGETAEVAFDVTANHGGGYSYRLCPAESELTEECFHDTVLTYATDTHFIQFGDDWNDRTEIPALRTTKGTFPANSTWSRMPIPACNNGNGGGAASGCPPPMFPAPLADDPRFPATQFKKSPGLYGFGLGGCQQSEGGYEWLCGAEEYEYWYQLFRFNIIDIVNVPEGLSGHYILSWRWDVEQTPQVWNGCSDVFIE